MDNSHIHQRLLDGYINATALCKACGKNLADYARLKTTKEFLEELSSDMGIPMSAVFQVVRGGEPQFQGTWVHPQVAINLAQWASPKFAVLVSKWVFEWMQGKVKTQKNNKCFFRQEYKHYLEGNNNAIPPKSDNAINPDGSLTENYRYRHFILKVQDAFIEKTCSWLKNHYRDYMHNPTGEKLEAFFGGDMCNDFEKYMKGE